MDAVIVGNQRMSPRIVQNLDAILCGAGMQCCDETRAAAPGFYGHAAPELEPALDLERLAAVDGLELNSLGAHPDHGLQAFGDQQFRHVRIGAVLRDPAHIVEELGLRVGAEICARDLIFREVGHDFAQVVDAGIGKAHAAGGKGAVSAMLLFRSAFENQYGRARFPR